MRERLRNPQCFDHPGKEQDEAEHHAAIARDEVDPVGEYQYAEHYQKRAAKAQSGENEEARFRPCFMVVRGMVRQLVHTKILICAGDTAI